MKAFIIFLLISCTSFSQIKQINSEERKSVPDDQPDQSYTTFQIGVITSMAEPLIECLKKDSTYTFRYQNYKHSKNRKIKSFSFKNVDNDFDKLYNLILDGFKDPVLNNTESVMLELPNDFIWLEYRKSLGVVNFRFKQAAEKDPNKTSYSAWLSNDKVRKLFGKE